MLSRWIQLAVIVGMLLLGTGSIHAQTDTPTPSPTPTPTATPAGPQPNQRTVIPVGTLVMWAGNSTPTGWLVADGSCVSRTTYDDLFYVVGTTFGVCDGSTTFGIPDMRGRVPVGAGTGTGLTARSPGQTFGEETHTLTVGEMPQHVHNLPWSTQSLTISSAGPSRDLARPGGTLTTTDDTGEGWAHNIMQPSLVVNFLIWTGTEILDIEGGTVLTNTPDPIRVDATVEVAGTPQAVSFSYAATGGDVLISILLFVSVGLQILQLTFTALRGKK